MVCVDIGDVERAFRSRWLVEHFDRDSNGVLAVDVLRSDFVRPGVGTFGRPNMQPAVAVLGFELHTPAGADLRAVWPAPDNLRLGLAFVRGVKVDGLAGPDLQRLKRA